MKLLSASATALRLDWKHLQALSMVSLSRLPITCLILLNRESEVMWGVFVIARPYHKK